LPTGRGKPYSHGMSALKKILAKIDADELVELTRELIRIPSVYRPDDPAATEAIEDFVLAIAHGAV